MNYFRCPITDVGLRSLIPGRARYLQLRFASKIRQRQELKGLNDDEHRLLYQHGVGKLSPAEIKAIRRECRRDWWRMMYSNCKKRITQSIHSRLYPIKRYLGMIPGPAPLTPRRQKIVPSVITDRAGKQYFLCPVSQLIFANEKEFQTHLGELICEQSAHGVAVATVDVRRLLHRAKGGTPRLAELMTDQAGVSVQAGPVKPLLPHIQSLCTDWKIVQIHIASDDVRIAEIRDYYDKNVCFLFSDQIAELRNFQHNPNEYQLTSAKGARGKQHEQRI